MVPEAITLSDEYEKVVRRLFEPEVREVSSPPSSSQTPFNQEMQFQQQTPSGEQTMFPHETQSEQQTQFDLGMACNVNPEMPFSELPFSEWPICPEGTRYVLADVESEILFPLLPEFAQFAARDLERKRIYRDALARLTPLGPRAQRHWCKATVSSWFRNNDPTKSCVKAKLQPPLSVEETQPGPAVPTKRGKPNCGLPVKGVIPIKQKNDIDQMFLQVTKTLDHAAREEALAGFKHDRADIIAVIKNLPRHWVGIMRPSKHKNPKGGRFIYRLRVFDNRRPGGIPVFDIFFGSRFGDMAIYPAKRGYEICCRDFYYSEETPIEEASPDRATAFYLPLRERAFDMSGWHHHPYNVFCRALLSVRLENIVDPSLYDILSPQIAAEIEKRRQRGNNSTAFLTVLAAMKRNALVRVFVSKKADKNGKLPNIGLDGNGTNLWLSQLIWVFPHAIPMLRKSPNAKILDGTFTIAAPMTLELLCVTVANETSVIGLCIAPTESTSSMVSLYQAVIEYMEDNGLDKSDLTGLPLISDQGKGLEVLVNEFHLDWKACHRHLIENFGASGIVGSWACRFMRCCSQIEFDRERQVVLREIDIRYGTGEFPKNDVKFDHLCQMLHWTPPGRTIIESRFSMPKYWSRWERYGSASTSNGIESIHAKLNRLKHSREVFLSRVVKVLNYCVDRFENRNSDYRKKHRASNRYWSTVEDQSNLMHSISRDPGRRRFYEELNWNDKLKECNGSKMDWEYPEYDMDNVKSPPNIQVVYQDDAESPQDLPPRRRVDCDPDVLSVLFGEVDPTDNSLPKVCPEGFDDFRDTAWRITFSIRPMLSRTSHADWTDIIVRVSGIGNALGLMRSKVTVSDVEEVQWRKEVYIEFMIDGWHTRFQSTIKWPSKGTDEKGTRTGKRRERRQVSKGNPTFSD
jgi:hypothetical protein